MSDGGRGLRGDDGAISTLFVVLLAFGVLMGFLALSVDVGRTVLERRELQNGADAGALSLAQSCADENCVPGADGLAALVNSNAGDSQHAVTLQCGSAGTGLPECPAGALQNLKQCPPLPGGFDSVPFVEVHTQTSAEGASFLQNIFGAAAGGTAETTVDACARAAWGAPGSTGTTFPLTIRLCNFNRATNNGTDFAPSPPYSPAPVVPNANPVSNVPAAVAPFVTHILAHGSGNPSDVCGPTMYAPGGFGWLSDGATADCRAEFSSGGTAPGDPGAAPSQGCKNDGIRQWVGKEVLIPVFSTVAGTGSGATYTLSGISSFYLAGWREMQTASPGKDYGVYVMPSRLPGSSEDDMCMTLDPPPDQLKKATCIWGWFTSPIVPVGTIDPSAPPRGPVVIQMAG